MPEETPQRKHPVFLQQFYLPILPAQADQAVLEQGPKSLDIDFGAKYLIVFSNSGRGTTFCTWKIFFVENGQKNVSARATEILDSLMIWFS